MRIVKLNENKRPEVNDEVKVTTAGNITEVMYASDLGRTCPIIRLGNDKYAVTSEVKRYKLDIDELLNGEHEKFVYEFENKAETRADNIEKVRSTLRYLRALINANSVDVRRLRWVTLTYAENMNDSQRLYKDFKNFVGRLRYDLGHFEYIAIAEPQGRGAWHMHVIMIFDDTAPYIANRVPSKPVDWVYDNEKTWDENYKALIADSRCDAPLFRAWRNGWVTVRRLFDIDNVGAYVSSYLTDMELSEFNALGKEEIARAIAGGATRIEKEVNGKTKKFVKGARLFLYPDKFNIFRVSRGIKRPVVEYMQESEAREVVDENTLTGETTIKLEFDHVGRYGETWVTERIVNHRYYNKLRFREPDG